MTIKVFVKKPEKVEVLQYDGTNNDEVVKFAGEKFCKKIKGNLAKGDYIVKYGDYNMITTIYKPNFAKQELIGSYTKDAFQGVNPNGRISLEKLQEFFEVPIVDDRKKVEYEPQNSNHTSKSSSFSLRDLVMQIAPKHIKYYIKRLEEYGFKIYSVSEAWFSAEESYLPFITLEDKIGNSVVITNRNRARDIGGDCSAFVFKTYNSRCEQAEFEVKNNNWREAFNKLVASFPDEITKNTNHHNTNTSR